VKEIEVLVSNALGLHARAAARFVHAANGFRSRILVARNDSRVDGKSILGLLTLAAASGTRLRLSAEGEDEEQAIATLAGLVRDRFGEER
jgi:phosphocarrier protein